MCVWCVCCVHCVLCAVLCCVCVACCGVWGVGHVCVCGVGREGGGGGILHLIFNCNLHIAHSLYHIRIKMFLQCKQNININRFIKHPQMGCEKKINTGNLMFVCFVCLCVSVCFVCVFCVCVFCVCGCVVCVWVCVSVGLC